MVRHAGEILNTQSRAEALQHLVECAEIGRDVLRGVGEGCRRAVAHAHRSLRPQSGGALAWRWEVEALEIVAWEIALAAAALLTDTGRCARIRICGNPACDWMFLDESRTGQRRWCRMNVCGNEAKVRRFRERQRKDR